MLITCLGHAKFLIELSDGRRIVTDPFDPSTGYPVGCVRCDAVTVSHHHHDHDAVDTLRCGGPVLDTEGSFTPMEGVRVTMLRSFHDNAGGSQRGENLIAVIEAEGLRVVHLGDLGHLPDEALYGRIGQPDLLLIPIGGHFTIDAAQARRVCDRLQPRVILPMHYRTGANASWPIAEPEAFLDQYPGQWERLALLRVTRQDLACQPRVALLTPTCVEDGGAPC